MGPLGSSWKVSTIEYPRSPTSDTPAAMAGPLKAELSALSQPSTVYRVVSR